ncbi:endonuclease/exonuclease/phosphatase family protein [Propionivibrio limicola]|uniref:endonuclease/exonuclease/phosphatase family protein n=1 Tax=Propionivibrio limicola TaxID=167645 RepID=UPI001290CB5C|nr:endonuclease/exonuclease/phosphatase family protein [Propionivibrio limicola]
MKSQKLHVVTYNIHKGFSQFNRHMRVHELRDELRALGPDIVFLQEVLGQHSRHAARIENWPEKAQHDFLAQDVWESSAYGRNVAYDHGHHGNAILARFPIVHAHNQDVTHLRFERRGLLHCTINVPNVDQPLHCVCVHLSLFARSRRKQMDALAAYLEQAAGNDSPLIIAGDFNDWRNEADALLAQRLGLTEVFGGSGGSESPGRSFPARRPMLRLDRIYVRGFAIADAKVHSGRPWSQISDHAPLSAGLILNG